MNEKGGVVYAQNKKESVAEAIGYRGQENSIVIEKVYEGVSVKKIGAYAFFGCRLVEELEIPVSVVEIEERAFSGCENLRTVRYGGRVVDWGVVIRGYPWKEGAPVKEVFCTDGVVAL